MRTKTDFFQFTSFLLEEYYLVQHSPIENSVTAAQLDYVLEGIIEYMSLNVKTKYADIHSLFVLYKTGVSLEVFDSSR